MHNKTKGDIIMKRKTLILATLAIFTFTLAGCQQAPETPDATVQAQQDNIGNGGQNQMQATAPSGNQIAGTQSSNVQNPGTQNTDTQNTGTQSSNTQNTKEIALADAGITEADVLAILAKRDFDDGRIVYDVDFYSQNQEFDYEIDAVTGAIISRDFEIEDDFLYQSQITGNGAAAGTISMEQATAIVLNRVSGATAQNVFMKLDHDDGYLKYEGEVYYNGVEYEFELNAQTGDVLEWSEERKGY